MPHLTPELLHAIDRAEIPLRLAIELGREHLKAICPTCRDAMDVYAAQAASRGAERPEDYGRTIETVQQRLESEERSARAEERQARRWLREILRLPRGKRKGRIRGAYKYFQGRRFGELLLDAARDALPEDPAESLSLAEGAETSARKTNPDYPDPNLLVPALALQGNAHRALGADRKAEELLVKARGLLETTPVVDLTIYAELDSFTGMLYKEQRRLDEAARLFHRAALLYRLVGETERVAKQRRKLAYIHYLRHEYDAGIKVLDQVLTRASRPSGPELNDHLHACIIHTLALLFHAKGDLDRTEATLDAHHDLLDSTGGGMRFRVVWLRARVAWSREELERARELFEEAHRRAEARGIPFDVSVVSLELALVHLVEGRTDLVKTLATRAARVFAEEDIQHETLAAVRLAEEAARREEATRELLETTIAGLEHARLRGRRGTDEPS